MNAEDIIIKDYEGNECTLAEHIDPYVETDLMDMENWYESKLEEEGYIWLPKIHILDELDFYTYLSDYYSECFDIAYEYYCRNIAEGLNLELVFNRNNGDYRLYLKED